MKRIYLVLYTIILNVFLAGISNAHSSCHDYLDERHILQSWPRETVAWLKQHEVPSDLKTTIEACIIQEEILQCLSSIYTRYSLSYEQLTLLEKKGFRFLGGKLTIFEIQSIPGYIFKIAKPYAGRSELFNVARIAQAQALRKSIRRWGLRITVPKKYAFIMPKLDTKNYKNLPKIIVVCQKIDIHQQPSKQWRHILGKMWLRLKGMRDLRKSNLYRTKTGLALIDTEPWKTTISAYLVPGFDKNTSYLTDKGLVIRTAKTA